MDNLDIIALLVFILTFVTGKEAAAMLGPWAAIVVAACAGAAFSLSGVKASSLRNGLWYFFSRAFLAFALTAAIAKALQAWMGWNPSVTLIPVAFAIGFIRDREHLTDMVTTVTDLVGKIASWKKS